MRITDENKFELMNDFVVKMMALAESHLDSIIGIGPGRRENFKKALSKELQILEKKFTETQKDLENISKRMFKLISE